MSIILTTLAAKAYKNQSGIIDALIEILKEMPKYIEKRNDKWWVANPVDPDENFADKWNENPERKQAFYKWLEQAQKDFFVVSQEKTLNEAVDLLTAPLGQRVVDKVANDLGVKRASVTRITTIIPHIPAIGDTSHCLTPQWQIQLNYKSNITATVHTKRYGKRVWSLADRSVPKNVYLKFTVKTNTPPPYVIKWQVVNTGREAAEARQLRGDFYSSDESTSITRWETTAYTGTHWVEAFVIKDGRCVTRSGRKYVKVR